MLKDICKSNRGLLLIFFVICVAPAGLIRITQFYYDRAIAYGNSGTNIEGFYIVLFSFSMFCSLVSLLFAIWAGLSRKRIIRDGFWATCVIVLVLNILIIPPLLGISLIALTVLVLAVSRAKLVLFLFVLASYFFLTNGLHHYVENGRKLASVRWAQYNIEIIGFLTRCYVHQHGTFNIDDHQWKEGLINYIQKHSRPLPWAPHAHRPFPFHSFNSNIEGLTDDSIRSDDILIFEKPFESSGIAEDPDTIRIAEKKFIRVVTYDGNLFRYIPKDDQYIPVKMRLLDRWSIGLQVEPNCLDGLRKNPSDGQSQ